MLNGSDMRIDGGMCMAPSFEVNDMGEMNLLDPHAINDLTATFVSSVTVDRLERPPCGS